VFADVNTYTSDVMHSSDRGIRRI